MPEIKGVPKLEPDEDGKFRCHLPECEGLDVNYTLPQHLGVHRLHTHGIKGATRDRDRPKRPIGRPRKDRPGPLSAEDICAAALDALVSGQNIRLTAQAITSFNEWVRQTETFLDKLLG